MIDSVFLHTCPLCNRAFCVEERGLDDVHCQLCWESICSEEWWNYYERIDFKLKCASLRSEGLLPSFEIKSGISQALNALRSWLHPKWHDRYFWWYLIPAYQGLCPDKKTSPESSDALAAIFKAAHERIKESKEATHADAA